MRFAWMFLAAAATLSGPAAAQEARPALAEPSLSPDGTTIAFASGGDIWEVPSSGGVARLLVSDAAHESRPLYSPDGSRIAFASTRGGSANVYVLDIASGRITRLTYAEATEEPSGWSGDGEWVYFTTNALDAGRTPDVYKVAVRGGTPIEASGERFLEEYMGAPSPDGSQLAVMVRGIASSQWWRNGHSHIDENELWLEPQRGGQPVRLLGDAERHEWPLWSGDGTALSYVSTKGGAENLWRVPARDGAEPERLTSFADGRVLFPSMSRDGGRYVFERDFALWSFAPGSVPQPLAITLRGAPAVPARERARIDRFDKLAVAPDGQKVAVIGRGEVFAAPTKEGGTAQRLTTTAKPEREAVWSPDSRKVLVVAERGLEHRLIEIDAASGAETVLGAGGIISLPAYAPDGKAIAYVRNARELHLLSPGKGGAGGDRVLYSGALGVDGNDGPRPVFSPDGQYLAFPVTDTRGFTNVWVVPTAGGEARPVSFVGNSFLSAIAWAPDASYILFDTTQRTEDPRIVRIDLQPRLPKFREDVFRGLFDASRPPGSTDAPKEAKPAPAREAAAKPGGPKPTKIVWEGLRDRASVLPLGSSATAPLIAPDGKTLFYLASIRGSDNVYSYSLDELAAEKPVPKQVSQSDGAKSGLALSADGKILFYLDGGRVFSTPTDNPRPKAIDVDAAMDIDFAAEKGAVFDEAWSWLDRQFYDAGFNGKDWKGLREHYLPFVAGARTPDELRRIGNLMIGELNASHMGLIRPRRGPGSLPTDRVGMIGVRFDPAAQALVVRDVMNLSPAALAGIAKGDRIVAVEGKAVDAGDNFDALLENRVGKRVALSVQSPAGAKREVVVQPVAATTAAGLAYRDWVLSRRALVERLSGGRLGYVHMADMSEDSLNQLYLDLDAANQGREGVVIDVRNNNGGFVNGYALDVFARRNYLSMTPRDLFAIPSRTALGQRALGLPTALVTNASSLSDAEDFTEGYRALGLGKVVGQPTAGWIIFTSNVQLLDGSLVRVPSVRIRDGKGQDMEMNPRSVDIAVERPLGETAAGSDAQLAAAVATLLAELPKR